mmetsp:Transcript_6063/g.18323  ORF Transcript_6063/g.18323 Transcript_6063/m.18323 type:complete len:228 (-) Transcript_6063:289-972(-)
MSRPVILPSLATLPTLPIQACTQLDLFSSASESRWRPSSRPKRTMAIASSMKDRALHGCRRGLIGFTICMANSLPARRILTPTSSALRSSSNWKSSLRFSRATCLCTVNMAASGRAFALSSVDRATSSSRSPAAAAEIVGNESSASFTRALREASPSPSTSMDSSSTARFCEATAVLTVLDRYPKYFCFVYVPLSPPRTLRTASGSVTTTNGVDITQKTLLGEPMYS